MLLRTAPLTAVLEVDKKLRRVNKVVPAERISLIKFYVFEPAEVTDRLQGHTVTSPCLFWFSG